MFIAGAAAAALVGASAHAQSAPSAAGAALSREQAARSFGARESVKSIRISPDGRSLLYVAPGRGRSSAVYVVDLASGASQNATSVDGVEQEIEWCNWVSGRRLVCSIYGLRSLQGEAFAASRLVALDHDGSNVVVLGAREIGSAFSRRTYGGDLVDWLPQEENHLLMMMPIATGRPNGGLGVVRVNTVTNSSDVVERPVPNATSFISDGHGQIRVMGVRRQHGATQMAAEEVEYRYRPAGSGEWRHLAMYNSMNNDGTRVLAVSPSENAAYVLEKLNGRQALYRLALDGSGRKERLLEHDEVDVDGVIRIGRARRVIGGTFATEFRQAAYFDPEIKALAGALSRALPRLPLVDIVDASADERRLLIRAGSDADPGRYYTYDKSSRQLNEIMLARPQLESVRLAEVRPVRYPASDGTMIPAYLTLPPNSGGRGLPAIVLPHGGPGSRDEWGFDWLAQFFANRGFAVLQPNFRGSSGYGDDWFQNNGFQSWRTAVGDANDAARWLVSQGIADPSKLAVVGWSYGGYVALQSNVLDQSLFKAVIAIAPVTDLPLLKEEARGSTGFRLLRDFIGSGPHVRQGSPAQNAASISAPVLLFHGELDLNVDIAQSELMAKRLRDAGRPVELVEYEGLDHYLEDSQARADMLARSDAFLRSALKM
jgi:dipeptidyl aminopeptidase/acylaminoacyl peptidase